MTFEMSLMAQYMRMYEPKDMSRVSCALQRVRNEQLKEVIDMIHVDMCR